MGEPAAQAATIGSLLATLGQIERTSARIERLAASQADAEAQLACAAHRAYRTGEATFADIAAIYQRLRLTGLVGFSKRWDAEVTTSEIRSGVLGRGARVTPNGSHGTWEGAWPLGDEPAPVTGTSVVYVLYDASNAPCYVGSTFRFRSRLHHHAKDGKRFVRWVAHPCRDREEAYALETRLLREHRPYLNRKTGR